MDTLLVEVVEGADVAARLQVAEEEEEESDLRRETRNCAANFKFLPTTEPLGVGTGLSFRYFWELLKIHDLKCAGVL